MEFAEIKGDYDCIVSLGSSREPAAHLRRKGLRAFSSPLDWVVSLSLMDVNLLLGSRFSGYMDVFADIETVMPGRAYFVKSYYYNVISVHDFPVLEGEEWSTVYPGFKEEINMRSQHLLDQLMASSRALFIRWGGTYDEAVALQETLRPLIGGEYQLLIVNEVDGLESVTDNAWGLPGISSLSIPDRAGDCETWDYILDGISLV